MAENIWHNIAVEEVVKILDSDSRRGLTSEQALERQKKFGKNSLPSDKPLSGAVIFFSQFRSPLIYILIFAGLATLFFKEWADSAVIFGSVVLNTIVGFFQENKAGKALRALKRMVVIEAVVLRDGREIKINSEELVLGDIIVLSEGNKVPADARLIEARHLKIQEAPLTGEWLASSKKTDVFPENTPLADRDNMAYMGCTIESGKAAAIVVAVGRDSQMGNIASLVKETREEKTPLQKKIARLGRIVGAAIGAIVLFMFAEGILQGRDPFEMFMTSVAVAVAAIPEGLPVAMTVILALGMQRILKKNGLVRKLAAAEILGSTSVVATDKTLTLTQGKMEAVKIITEDAPLMFKIIILTSRGAFGSPTDQALLSAAARAGFTKSELDKSYIKLDEIPFNSQNKFTAALVQPKESKDSQLILVSGAPEKIISFSSLEQEASQKLNLKLRELTGSGLRVVAFGYKEIANHETEIADINKEIGNLNFAGLVGLRDPLRPEAKEAFIACRRAGLKPIIVTGDHLLTAKLVASELGLEINDNNVIEGSELDNISDKELLERAKDINVYARVEPRHKLRIIEVWQKKGEVVAMTGDGVNDTPALKRADMGVALGSGTDAAKEVSDMVLLSDNFNIIVFAVEEGRAIIDNMRKVVTYLLSDSFTETILIGASIILGWPLPVTAAQILWINLVEDGLPNIALAFEPKEKDVLSRKPEKKNAPLLTGDMKAIIFAIGILTDLIIVGLLWQLLRLDYDIQYIRTVIFTALGIDSLFYVFSCKSLRRNLWRVNIFSNKLLLAAVGVGFSAILAALYLPQLQSLLKTVPLRPQEWLVVIALGLLNVILIESAKYFSISRRKNRA